MQEKGFLVDMRRHHISMYLVEVVMVLINNYQIPCGNTICTYYKVDYYLIKHMK